MAYCRMTAWSKVSVGRTPVYCLSLAVISLCSKEVFLARSHSSLDRNANVFHDTETTSLSPTRVNARDSVTSTEKGKLIIHSQETVPEEIMDNPSSPKFQPVGSEIPSLDQNYLTTMSRSTGAARPDVHNVSVPIQTSVDESKGSHNTHDSEFVTSTSRTAVSDSVTFFSTATTGQHINTLSPGRELVFSDQIVLACFLSEKYLQYRADRGMVYFHKPRELNITGLYKCTLIITGGDSEVMEVTVHHVMSRCGDYFLLNVLDEVKQALLTSRFACEQRDLTSSVVHSYSNQIRIELTADFADTTFSLNLSFRAVPDSFWPSLEMKFTSNTSGYLQTPGWEKEQQYPPYMDKSLLLEVPRDYSIMLSFAGLNISEGKELCLTDKISLHAYINNSTVLLWSLCTNSPPKPAVYSFNLLRLRFRSEGSPKSGFRIRFSFHKKLELPEKSSGDKWNCSVPFWPEFRLHFPCDLFQQCERGEDEEDCEYTSETCGTGYLDVGGRCYIYFSADRLISWNDASVECLLRNSRLASLNTREEWHLIARLLSRYKFHQAYVGFQSTLPSMPHLYQSAFQWADGTIAYYLALHGTLKKPACGSLQSTWFDVNRELYYISVINCHDKRGTMKVLCELESNGEDKSEYKLADVKGGIVSSSGPMNIRYVTCPEGHLTHEFLACDVRSACWSRGQQDSMTSCPAPPTPLPPLFRCDNAMESVPYTLVCDYRQDCSDNSDEYFCIFPACTVSAPFQCGNRQCVSMEERCDSLQQCLDGDDEMQCIPYLGNTGIITPSPPAVVNFDGMGNFLVQELNSTQRSPLLCPDTHFECASLSNYCLPIYVRCNGVYDCPGREDEEDCESFACPGFFRCRGSRICVHPDHVCDGVLHCPQREDEFLCGLKCPQECTCYGLTYTCWMPVHPTEVSSLRFLDFHGSNMTLNEIKSMDFLIYLSLAMCNMVEVRLPHLPNLKTLDVSDNRIAFLTDTQLRQMDNLESLKLAGNPLTLPYFYSHDAKVSFSTVRVLDISRVHISKLNVSVLSIFPNLRTLNITGDGITEILSGGFSSLLKLEILDMRHCPVTFFHQDLFDALKQLRMIVADNYKLCCPSLLPAGFNSQNCLAPSDEISSCKALLRSDIYRAFLSVFASLALLGNLASFVYRVFLKAATRLSFDIFVTHLCVADFLMGSYLAVIGIADRIFQGTYLWEDLAWKSSSACKMAGFLSLLSTEVSALIICLITLDRFLVLRFPFGNLRFHAASAQVACGIVWLLGAALAGVPLLPVMSHWEFYSQNGICIPLPVTRVSFAGHAYAFGLMIALNFVLFLVVALGQLVIFLSIRVNSIGRTASTKKSRDFTIARRLFIVAMSDFFCWFPICLLGLLAADGAAISGEVNVAMAIFVLPLNSALNPFLYTLNVLLEGRCQGPKHSLNTQASETFRYPQCTCQQAEAEARQKGMTHLENPV